MGEFKHNVGDIVKWTSSSRGTVVDKAGKVLAHVPAKVRLATVVAGLRHDLRDLGLASAVDQAKADRYLVAVSVPPRTKGRKATTKYYVPLASNIDKQMARAEKAAEKPKRARKA